MKARLLLLIVIVAACAGLLYAFATPLAIRQAKRTAVQHLGQDAMAALPDGLHAGVCGAGSPFPDSKRGGPCTLVIAGTRVFVFDAGSGSARSISRMHFDTGGIEAIFLTHFHSDHIDGLGELMLQRWTVGAIAEPVRVHGPSGVEAVVAGFMQAYGQDQQYRVAHHGEQTVSPTGFGGSAQPFAIGTDGRVVILKDADLEIAAFEVDHPPVHPAVGYSIRYKGRSIVLSGDTKQSASVKREATGADVLVHEAMSMRLMTALRDGAAQAERANLAKVFGDVLTYHASPEQAAETARDAGVKYLLLNHIAPPLPLSALNRAFLGDAADIYSGPIRIGVDGDFISLPAGSAEVIVSRRY